VEWKYKHRGNYLLIRREYKSEPLRRCDLPPNPITVIKKWLSEAIESGIPDPNACVLSTSDKNGNVSSRTVLIKKITDEGLIFFTNYNSRKSNQISENNNVSLLFPWYALNRQLHIEGKAYRISREESEEYFRMRDRLSQIGAWASHQSEPLPSRFHLMVRASFYYLKFLGREVPCPPFWGGFIVKPHRVELWQGRPHRMHDRFVYIKNGDEWEIKRLYP